ncbi:hypothetical protein ACFL6M_01370 [Candidatus Eisenbacteria bacterium]|uniref:WYL domain-containing protein n=1 Tax=Eiseniibacteriota bacterium TaxID=2212470 RepID=A0ABV6YJ45_UNCEI
MRATDAGSAFILPHHTRAWGRQDAREYGTGSLRQSPMSATTRAGKYMCVRIALDTTRPPGQWAFIKDVPARCEDNYTTVCKTACDSTIFGELRVDTLREIMVSKICILIGRCEIKDVIDLCFLNRRGSTVRDHFESASQKEDGLDPAMMSFVLARMQIDGIPDYVLEPHTLDELRSSVASLRRKFAKMACPQS